MKNEREEMLKKVWNGMKSWERFMTTALIFVGILMSLSGIVMMIRGCQAM